MVESISKTPVSRHVAESIVSDAFGPEASLVEFDECTEGWFNAAHRLTLADGRRFVLKVAPPPDVAVLTYEHDIMATEVAAMRLVHERTSVPVPTVVWSDTSCRRLPSPLFVMTCCDGTLLSELRRTLSPDQQRHVDAQLARFLRAMHSITHSTFGLQAPTAPTFDRWSEAFHRLVDDLLADGERAGVALPVHPDRLRTLVRDHSDVLDEVAIASFVHWDLWDPNVFIDPVTLDVVGVIDFERALWGDPLMEGQFFGKTAESPFLDDYGIPALATPEARQRRLLYDMYLFLVMTIESTYRHYPTDDIERMGRRQLDVTLGSLGLD